MLQTYILSLNLSIVRIEDCGSIQSKHTQYFAYNENLARNHSFEGGFFQQHPHKWHLTRIPSGNERNVIELIDINLLLLDMGHLCECVRVYTTL